MYNDGVLQSSLAGFQDQLAGLQSTFQKQLKEQQERFAEAQRKQEERIRLMQQQALESQVRQASQQQTAQVLAPKNPMVIRPGGSSRFSRPKLQIKSINI